ncbi:MAG TPA: hypothetical protein DEF34_00230 [Desulfotomaculum sp.]|nr:MAG: hypothetical protein JL56_14260 [Desulfotomaculum sp. BICA1-6]HBX22052.1 hypothetical protein [Desulfotomaculum sp.]
MGKITWVKNKNIPAPLRDGMLWPRGTTLFVPDIYPEPLIRVRENTSDTPFLLTVKDSGPA